MKILVIGGGGREHAIVWRLSKSPGLRLYASPGNPGIGELAELIPSPSSPVRYADIAETLGVALTVVGPEAPLVAGIVDAFEERGLRIAGPTQAAARLEGSKIFAKQFFTRAGIPTARSVEVASSQEAAEALEQFTLPVVIKADGLAGGKGVIIARTPKEAVEATQSLGPRLVIEEFLEGEEVSFIGISNGREIVPLEASQDHKRVGEGDTGPNTGGMGAYSDGRILTPGQIGTVMDRIMGPAVSAMAREGAPFRGFLYAGLMMTQDGPKVLEFNVRLGDPETQALLYRLDEGFLDALAFAAGGSRPRLQWNPGPAVCVVLAAERYPESPVTGDVISGLNTHDGVVFHAGTQRNESGALVTAGGRVLGVTAGGTSLPAAIAAAYHAVAPIRFRGMHYRRDIGQKGLRRWLPTAARGTAARGTDPVPG